MNRVSSAGYRGLPTRLPLSGQPINNRTHAAE